MSTISVSPEAPCRCHTKLLTSGFDVLAVFAMETFLESSLPSHCGLCIPMVTLQHQKGQFLNLYI